MTVVAVVGGFRLPVRPSYDLILLARRSCWRLVRRCGIGLLLLLIFPFAPTVANDNHPVIPVLAQSGLVVDSSHEINHEFNFARLVYQEGGWSDWPRWRADWPEAEWHFLRGLQRLSRVDANSEGVLVSLKDTSLFDYPWLYAVEVGALHLSSTEAANLREYLLRGGFLMVDDFHGIDQWLRFSENMKRVFPERKIEELGDGTQLFSVLYDIESTLQIPGIRPLMANRTWEYGGVIPRWRVIRDKESRVMVAINFNMDLGDAWEHADDSRYPQRYSSLAYRIGTNYVLYALTH